MVTLYYLRRFFNFFETILANNKTKEVEISNEDNFFDKVYGTLKQHKDLLKGAINENKKTILDALVAQEVILEILSIIRYLMAEKVFLI